MDKSSHSLSLGSAAYAAKRATDVLGVLQNKIALDDKMLIERVNEVLTSYHERDHITQADLEDLRLVAPKLVAVFSTPDTSEAASLLNELLQEYAGAPRLSAHSASSWHIHVDSSDHVSWTQWFAASSALALAILLAEKQRNPGGLCAVCQCPFIDLGKGGGRRYCSSRCATRERVAAYRRRTHSNT
jgi:hypothetical protein